MIEAWAGSVSGATVRAAVKVIPSAARASRYGVVPAGAPYAPSASARVVSSVTSNAFGGPLRPHDAAHRASAIQRGRARAPRGLRGRLRR